MNISSSSLRKLPNLDLWMRSYPIDRHAKDHKIDYNVGYRKTKCDISPGAAIDRIPSGRGPEQSDPRPTLKHNGEEASKDPSNNDTNHDRG